MNIGSRWLEVTTRIGCSNMCFYCPQNTLIKSYRGQKIMRTGEFSQILANVDKNTAQIHFSGFSEAFLTDGAEHMMLEAYQKGYQVILFTTLTGFNQEKADFLSQNGMRFLSARIHDYPMEDRSVFEKNVKIFKRANIVDTFDIEKVLGNGASRGGKNYDVGFRYGSLSCMRFECNVVLPSGDLYLCCSDWGLKHRLGNLKMQHYDSTEIDLARGSFRVLAAQYDSDILCRTCEWAYRPSE